ncbi:deoxyribodipyrimidine photolyase-related protein [Muriicola jejuensis]|uniref:Cryptochrome/photolyase family protein n=1 Tax=Muriicola jejuensis TaxID=504488 RepID=A0A6P0UDC4_9FLAO|nr:cryptochrome/photolyase family protein [Muriicola jejuensis]NER09273.1 cryptochrome/photolyase family protein [Muriicola jejuensis]SMP09831.1 deoxyribodipyrimidine photolyase-related protein [Muriicola jejuensis]
MRTLRLILGDQLNLQHPWFQEVNPDCIYLMAEMRQETDYVRHHIQKVVAFFLSMRSFAESLKNQGHQVVYFRIGEQDNPQNLKELIQGQIEKQEAEKFEYLLPDEYRLDLQLREITSSLEIEVGHRDTEHFLTDRNTLKDFFEGKKQMVMESFYRMMRKKYGILMDQGEPEGGQWNYDKSNRKKWKGDPEIPGIPDLRKDVRELLEEIRQAGVSTIGNIDAQGFNWPTSREESLLLLDHFSKNLLQHFGDYQDALHTEQKFLFHSRLSFSMNSKMISPREVIDAVLSSYREQQEEIDISQVEGFVRQILGWREYMRGIYWKEMPGYKEKNALGNHHPLPDFFWTGKTRMNCLKHAIGQSLDEAYAHHIQRLMITGNYALLTQTDPDEVDAWYLGIYIDAVEWVEITNTRGMSQFADGGIVATKPYVSSANYIQKMGDYCSGCSYDHNAKTSEDACPFNALYWNFLDAKKEVFKDNPRMGMMLNLLSKKDKGEMEQIRERARKIIQHPEDF